MGQNLHCCLRDFSWERRFNKQKDLLKFCIPPYSKKVGCCSLVLRCFTQIFTFDVEYSNKHCPCNCGMNDHPPCFSVFELDTIDICCCLPEYICITLNVDHSNVAVTFREMFFSHTSKINKSVHSCHSKTFYIFSGL